MLTYSTCEVLGYVSHTKVDFTFLISFYGV